MSKNPKEISNEQQEKSGAELKLVDLEKDNDSLYFERRRNHRRRINCRLTAIRKEIQSDVHKNRITPLQLTNISDGGIAAISQDRITLETEIVVFFPPQGHEPGYDVHGRIVRCQPKEYGHEIGICFSNQQAAARA